MDNLNNKTCGIPRTVEDQICDLQYQINQLKKRLASGEYGSVLTCALVTTSAQLPSVYESNPLSIALSDFNRTPNVAESFFTLWNYTPSNAEGETFAVQWLVKSVADNAAYCTVSGYGSIQGAAGIPKRARGAYFNNVVYERGDIVDYEGSSFLYHNYTPSSGHAPAFTSEAAQYWQLIALKGDNGNDGNGISSVYSVGHRVEGNETITQVDVAYTDPEKATDTFEVHAQNGAAAVQSKTYVHKITATATYQSFTFNIFFDIITNSEALIKDTGQYPEGYFATVITGAIGGVVPPNIIITGANLADAKIAISIVGISGTSATFISSIASSTITIIDEFVYEA